MGWSHWKKKVLIQLWAVWPCSGKLASMVPPSYSSFLKSELCGANFTKWWKKFWNCFPNNFHTTADSQEICLNSILSQNGCFHLVELPNMLAFWDDKDSQELSVRCFWTKFEIYWRYSILSAVQASYFKTDYPDSSVLFSKRCRTILFNLVFQTWSGWKISSIFNSTWETWSSERAS